MTVPLPTNVIQRGEDAAASEPIDLEAGPLTMRFEPQSAFLRYVRVGDVEVVRGVYAAVRDHNWDTVTARVSDLELHRSAEGFRLRFVVTHHQDAVDFSWDGELAGRADGTVRFSLQGIAGSTFRRNRIGFCVLHPASCAGRPCTVEKVDGSTERGAFPDLISPHQPFKDVRAIAHEVSPGVTAQVRMEGDTFEMEDQRNWTDASYKTYCTPLDHPFPVEVHEGTRIEQSVTISVSGAPDAAASRSREPLHLEVARQDTEPMPLPKIGLGLASHGQGLEKREVERLRSLALAHLRVDLEGFEAGAMAAFEQAAVQARALATSLEVALFLSHDAELALRTAAAAASRLEAPVARWLVFHRDEKSTRARWLALAREHLASIAPVYGGTNAYFTELNRERPALDDIAGVAYSINPQVHAFDDASLVETLEMQRETVKSARAFAPAMPIAITPVTLKPRFNPNATGPEPEAAEGELPPEVDVRQASLFAAGWTLGSVKYLGEGGASSVTFFETTGWRGVMERTKGSPLPGVFRSLPGSVFPLYHVLADIGDFAGGEILPTATSDPLGVEVLALRAGERVRILAANLGGASRHLRLICPHLSEIVAIKTLSADEAEAAMLEPERFRADRGLRHEVRDGRIDLCIAPYATLRIDTTEVNRP